MFVLDSVDAVTDAVGVAVVVKEHQLEHQYEVEVGQLKQEAMLKRCCQCVCRDLHSSLSCAKQCR
jgi:hypothetical protein